MGTTHIVVHVGAEPDDAIRRLASTPDLRVEPGRGPTYRVTRHRHGRLARLVAPTRTCVIALNGDETATLTGDLAPTVADLLRRAVPAPAATEPQANPEPPPVPPTPQLLRPAAPTPAASPAAPSISTASSIPAASSTPAASASSTPAASSIPTAPVVAVTPTSPAPTSSPPPATSSPAPADCPAPTSSPAPADCPAPISSPAPAASSPAPSTPSVPAQLPVVTFDDGRRLTLDRSLLLGRDPAAEPGTLAVRIDDPDRSVSKTHCAAGVQPDGTAWVADRFSSNGTCIIDDDGTVYACPPGVAVEIPPGATVHFGERSFTVAVGR